MLCAPLPQLLIRWICCYHVSFSCLFCSCMLPYLCRGTPKYVNITVGWMGSLARTSKQISDPIFRIPDFTICVEH